MNEDDLLLPSGAQLELSHGDQYAVVTEVGATLRCYQVAGVDVIDGFPAGAMAAGGRGQVLCPWPNRVDGGRYDFGGKTLQLPLSEADRGNANHGLVRWLSWRIERHSVNQAELALLLRPQPGYPFFLSLHISYVLGDQGLSVKLTARNPGTTPIPYGAGQHPYLTAGTELVDQALLQLPAATRLCTNERGIPTGRMGVAGTPFDFQRARAIGALVLDSGYTDLARDADGWARVALAHPSGAPRVTMGLDAGYGYLQVFSGDTLAQPQRRRGLAVEPMTCAANAFRSGDGLLTLVPHEVRSTTWTLQVR